MEAPCYVRPAEYRGRKKWCAVFSNYKADIYEVWQLWLERDGIKYIYFSFSICSFVFKLHKFKVALSPDCGAKFVDFHPSNV